MLPRLLGAIVGLVVAGMATTAHAAIVYSQDWLGIVDGGSSYNSVASTTSFQQIADPFMLSEGATIQSLTWFGTDNWGENEAGGDLEGVSTQDFIIRFYADVSIPPGQANDLNHSPALLPFYEASVTANISYTGNTEFFDANPFGSYRAIYDFQANLTDPLLLIPIQIYWISILGVDHFGWTPAVPGNIVFRPCCDADGNPWLEERGLNHNMVFALNDELVAPVPLPAAFPLFATALAGMGLLGWWRKRKASV